MSSKIFKGIMQNIYVHYTGISGFNNSLPCHALPYLSSLSLSPQTLHFSLTFNDEMETLVQEEHKILISCLSPLIFFCKQKVQFTWNICSGILLQIQVELASKHNLVPALSIFTCIHHAFTSEASSQICSDLHIVSKAP